MARHRRSTFLINKKFQLRFALYVCSWMVALSFVYPLIVYNLFDYFMRYMSKDPNGPNILAIEELRHDVMFLLIALQASFLFVTFLVSIFMSHRIAGPIYKLKLFFAIARSGNLKDELNFREKDHFQELAQDYNDTIKSIRTRMEAAAAEIERALPESGPAARPALEKAVAQLRGLQR